MPYGLACHTTSTQLGLSLIDCNPEAATTPQTRSYDLGRDMITHLQQHTQQFLTPYTWSDLCWIAVAKGPGSFTSTRIGVVMARTIGQQLNLPVFGISTLEATAYADLRSPQNDRQPDLPNSSCERAVELGAARGEVFAGIYRYDPQRDDVACLQADAAMLPAVWHEQLAQRQPAPISLSVTPNRIVEDTAAMAMIARKRWLRGDRPPWSSVIPFYGQHPVTP